MVAVLFWFFIIVFIVVFTLYFTPLGLKHLYIRGDSLVVDNLFKRTVIPIKDITRIQLTFGKDEQQIKGIIINTATQAYNLTRGHGIVAKFFEPELDFTLIPQIIVKNPGIQTSHDLHAYVSAHKKTEVYMYKRQILRGLIILILLIAVIVALNTLDFGAF